MDFLLDILPILPAMIFGVAVLAFLFDIARSLRDLVRRAPETLWARITRGPLGLSMEGRMMPMAVGEQARVCMCDQTDNEGMTMCDVCRELAEEE